MKKNRKLTALLVAACMTIPMAATTFTVPMVASGVDITLSEENSSLEAYQIFKGTYSEGKLGVSGWGDAFIEGGQAGITNNMILPFLNALSEYEPLKENGISIFASAWSDSGVQSALNSDASKVAQDIADILASEDGKYAVPFARFIADYISKGNLNKSNGKSNDQITGLEDGYYIFADPSAPTSGTWSLGMLKVVGTGSGANITPKRTKPTVTKQVSSDSGALADQTDAEIGEMVHFKIECTIPKLDDNLEYYTAYYLEIEDTLGSAFDAPINVTLTKQDNSVIIASIPDGDNASNKNANDKTNGYYYTYDNTTKTIKVQIEDAKKLAQSSSDSKIYLEYDAVLNSNAEAGNNAFDNGNQKQINSVKLNYSNNPNVVWIPNNDGDTAETPTDIYTSLSPEDIVKVYTYQLVVNKVDVDKMPLQDVTFRLKRNSDNQYVVIDNNNKVSGWEDGNSLSNNSLLTTDSEGQITIIGLDNSSNSDYTLIEVKPLLGYNTVADKVIDIQVGFTEQVLTSLLPHEGQEDNTAIGKVDVEIINKQGATLPSTGGIGTKIFYILGGTLVIGSGAALVIKKRMGKDEE